MNKSFIVKKDKMDTSDWSGGNTTELFISPKNSSLQELDFDFRLSTASIDFEESQFTSLPGVDRILILLDGKLKLEHKGHHTKEIYTFDIDKFKGEWATKSYGKAIDLNLMMRKKYESKISGFVFFPNTEFKESNFADYSFIFLYKGELETTYGRMNEGDILVIGNKERYDIKTNEEATLVHISISLLK